METDKPLHRYISDESHMVVIGICAKMYTLLYLAYSNISYSPLFLFFFFLLLLLFIPADILLTSSFYTASFVVTLSFLALLVLAFSFMTRGGKTSRPCLYLGIKPNYISGRVGR